MKVPCVWVASLNQAIENPIQLTTAVWRLPSRRMEDAWLGLGCYILHHGRTGFARQANTSFTIFESTDDVSERDLVEHQGLIPFKSAKNNIVLRVSIWSDVKKKGALRKVFSCLCYDTLHKSGPNWKASRIIVGKQCHVLLDANLHGAPPYVNNKDILMALAKVEHNGARALSDKCHWNQGRRPAFLAAECLRSALYLLVF